jgi:hypothetical protein
MSAQGREPQDSGDNFAPQPTLEGGVYEISDYSLQRKSEFLRFSLTATKSEVV